MKKNLHVVLVALALILFASTTNADVVDFLDFSNDSDGVVHDTIDRPLPNSPVAGGAIPNDWLISYVPQNITSDATLNEFQAIGGIMRVQDWGGVGTLTGTWDATEDGTMDIEGIGVTLGNAAFNSTVSNGPFEMLPEGITWFYQINSDAAVEVFLGRVELTGDAGTPVADGTSVDNLFDDIAVSAGDTVSYGFTIAQNGANDGVVISSITIDFTQAIPEPASASVLAIGLIGLFARRKRN
ncbi:MAG: PEP-CTERM sorting domain-containing protein [Planctomycetota bacterium]